MKQIYQVPTTKVVNIELHKMIAASSTGVQIGGSYDGNSVIQSRRGGSAWEDEEEE